ncbi:hypothetical protein B0O99DRAFT_630697 [Bisporella sp. PMI_857]|nr:hypothetical protein B0O99DRAFT_630697 [Bisporella sp. PMI_857]
MTSSWPMGEVHRQQGGANGRLICGRCYASSLTGESHHGRKHLESPLRTGLGQPGHTRALSGRQNKLMESQNYSAACICRFIWLSLTSDSYSFSSFPSSRPTQFRKEYIYGTSSGQNCERQQRASYSLGLGCLILSDPSPLPLVILQSSFGHAPLL